MSEHPAETSEWYTPSDLLERVRTILPIAVDPCSCAAAQEVVQAKRYFTAADNGLERPWGDDNDAGLAFVNPPSGRSGNTTLPVRFYEKAVDELDYGNIRCFVFVCFNISQLQTLARKGYPQPFQHVCIPERRIAFWQPGRDRSRPERSNAIVFESYRNELDERFISAFSDYGTIMQVC